ncbi:hypothetical protein NKY66_11105 [Sinorhizobium meliloti]|uniref:hypothetical protein n=1 Tax=Rhizobium meliloti TaxID=382 RepID=UPI003D6472E9
MFSAIRRRVFKSAVVAEFHRLHGVNLRAIIDAGTLDELLNVQFEDCRGDQFKAAQAVAEVVQESFGIDIQNLRMRAERSEDRTIEVKGGAAPTKTAMDAFIETVYGKGAVRTAAPEVAKDLADRVLLRGRIPKRDIDAVCAQLCAGPIPYSTEDLAVSIALNFFRNPELKRTLRGAAANARAQAMIWKVEGRMAPALYESFHQTLHPIALEYVQATNRYAKEARALADKMFAQDWPSDPELSGLVDVAHELDTLHENSEKSDEIHDLIDVQFHAGKSVEQCATMLLQKHVANQKELQELQRR